MVAGREELGYKTRDYVNKTSRCSNRAFKVRAESETRTPSGQKVRDITQEHQVGQPHHPEQQVLVLHPQDPDTLAKSPRSGRWADSGSKTTNTV